MIPLPVEIAPTVPMVGKPDPLGEHWPASKWIGIGEESLRKARLGKDLVRIPQEKQSLARIW